MKKEKKVRIDCAKYSYRVIWSEEDGEYVGLCAEFPSLSWLEETQEKALSGIRKIVGDVVDEMISSSEEIPIPFNLMKFSGKLVVRMDPEVHRKLALEAQEKGISLNLLINSKISI